jgi:hypothetical protein
MRVFSKPSSKFFIGILFVAVVMQNVAIRQPVRAQSYPGVCSEASDIRYNLDSQKCRIGSWDKSPHQDPNKGYDGTYYNQGCRCTQLDDEGRCIGTYVPDGGYFCCEGTEDNEPYRCGGEYIDDCNQGVGWCGQVVYNVIKKPQPEDDKGTYKGCKTPQDNSTGNNSTGYMNDFGISPQKKAGDVQTPNITHDSTEENYKFPEEGQSNEGGQCGGSNGCGEAMCVYNPDYDKIESCRMDRGAGYRCGGTTGCGKAGVCKNDFVVSHWGTGIGDPGKGFQTQNYFDEDDIGGHVLKESDAPDLTKETYDLCEIQKEGSELAKEVCAITGENQVGSYKLACRCGQRDVCDLIDASNADLIANPLDLKIKSLQWEDVGDDGGDRMTSNGSDRGNINNRLQRNMQVEFDFADFYDRSPGQKQKDTLYTRLIEVCAVNLALSANPNAWEASSINSSECITRRVDGNEGLIMEPFYIPITISDRSQGPWTIRYRAINDVCNRTYGWAGPDHGNAIIGRFGESAGSQITPEYISSKRADDGFAVGQAQIITDPDTNVVESGRGIASTDRRTGLFGGIKSSGNFGQGFLRTGATGPTAYCFHGVAQTVAQDQVVLGSAVNSKSELNLPIDLDESFGIGSNSVHDTNTAWNSAAYTIPNQDVGRYVEKK